MRLIDADAFVQFLKDAVIIQGYENLKIDGLLTVADVIEAIISDLDGTSIAGYKNAPTIEPEQKKGKWLPDNNNYYEERFICSVCGKSYKVDTCMGKPMWDFCPCGADMRKEGDHE